MINCTHVVNKRCWSIPLCRKMALPNAQCDAEETECHLKSMARYMQSEEQTLKSHVFCRLCWAHKFSTIPASNECYSETEKVFIVPNISSYLTYMSVLPPVQLTRLWKQWLYTSKYILMWGLSETGIVTVGNGLSWGGASCYGRAGLERASRLARNIWNSNMQVTVKSVIPVCFIYYSQECQKCRTQILLVTVILSSRFSGGYN